MTRARHLPGQHHEVQDGNYTDTTLVEMITLEGSESVAEVQVDEDIYLPSQTWMSQWSWVDDRRN